MPWPMTLPRWFHRFLRGRHWEHEPFSFFRRVQQTLGRWLLLRDRLVFFDGSVAHVEDINSTRSVSPGTLLMPTDSFLCQLIPPAALFSCPKDLARHSCTWGSVRCLGLDRSRWSVSSRQTSTTILGRPSSPTSSHAHKFGERVGGIRLGQSRCS
jgi:hypothetical protein